jgi:hypothetical protein
MDTLPFVPHDKARTGCSWTHPRQRGDDAIQQYCDVNNGESIDAG